MQPMQGVFTGESSVDVFVSIPCAQIDINCAEVKSSVLKREQTCRLISTLLILNNNQDRRAVMRSFRLC